MHLVEWLYESGPIRSKLCTSEDLVRFWVDLARSQGAAMIIITQVGVC